MSAAKLKQNKQYKGVPTIKTAGLPPTEDEIRHRAHEIYLARGGGHGQELDDWFKAEAELKQTRSKEEGQQA